MAGVVISIPTIGLGEDRYSYTLPTACNTHPFLAAAAERGSAKGWGTSWSNPFESASWDDAKNEAGINHGTAQSIVVKKCTELGGKMAWGKTKEFRKYTTHKLTGVLTATLETPGNCQCDEKIAPK